MTDEELKALMLATRTEGYPEDLRPLVEAVQATEREACAKVCKDEARRAKWNWDNDISGNKPFWNGGEQLASSCADAIRARGEE
jgi:hypothetical protein